MKFDPSNIALKAPRAAAQQRVTCWARESVEQSLEGVESTSVAEVQCSDPGCVPIETLVLVEFAAGSREVAKVFCPLEEVTRDAVSDAVSELKGRLNAEGGPLSGPVPGRNDRGAPSGPIPSRGRGVVPLSLPASSSGLRRIEERRRRDEMVSGRIAGHDLECPCCAPDELEGIPDF